MTFAPRVKNALDAIGSGRPIVVFDSEGREGESDIVVHASAATPAIIELLRRDAGGLICLATDSKVAKKLQLPFLADLYATPAHGSKVLEKIAYRLAPYGDKPSFSVAINHRGTFTGISDKDRSLTATEFAKLASHASNGIREKFMRDFKSPGHLHLLIGRGIENRKGHTELALEIARLANMPPAMLVCELLSSVRPMTKRQAKAYAKKQGFAFVEGKDIIGAGARNAAKKGKAP